MAAAQGIDFRKETLGAAARLGRGTQPAYDLIRQQIPFLEQDTVMYPYMEASRKLITSGQLVTVVNRVVQDTVEL